MQTRSLRQRNGNSTRGDTGAVAVEFALVLPLLVTLLLGVTTAGISLSHSLGLANAVREGSRFAAVAPYTSASADDWRNDVFDRTRETQFDDPSIRTRVCVGLYKQGAVVPVVAACDGPTTDGGTSLGSPASFTVPATTPPDTCVVRVWAARKFSINGVLFNWERVMSRQSVAVYERGAC